MTATGLTGYARPHARFGVRNHVLVLPSVVCSSHAAGEIARGAVAVAITHQHGCLHVGDDLRNTERELIGTATNPNVGGVVVVGLGCETLQGRRLARLIGERGQRVEFVGIQAVGGTERAIQAGRQQVADLEAELAGSLREPVPADALVVGIDDDQDPVIDALRATLARRGLATLTTPGMTGAEAHVELAGQGAQVIVSLRGPGQAPTGFAVCPVLAVARDAELYAALRDDFDMQARDDVPASELAEQISDRVVATCDGAETAAERRGARDFVLRRLAMTM